MIRAFWQSKLAAAAALLLSAAVIVLLWSRSGGRPIYIPIVASVLMAAIGVLVGRLVGNIVANSQNVKYLGVLHMELDPEAFLREYAGIPGRLPETGLNHAIACAYLSDGYAAAGRFEEAAKVLCLPETCRDKKQLDAMKGMYWQKLCSCQLFAEDLPAARHSLENLDQVIKACSSEKLLANLRESRRLLQNRIAAQSNKQVETAWLEGQLKKAPYKLLRLEITQAMAYLALREGDPEKAAEQLDRLIEEGGSTFFPRWAEEKKAAL